MVANDNRVTYIGRTNYRNSGRLFGILQRDRRSHMYLVEKTGTGKSHLLKMMIAQDIAAGEGCALFDPHGDLSREVRDLVPADRMKDLMYVDVADFGCAWRFNPFSNIEPSNRALAAAGLVETFKKFWPDDWGPRLEHLLRNVIFALLNTPDSSFADIPKLLTDRHYRSDVVNNLTDPVVRASWKDEFANYSLGFRSVVTAPLQNKIGALLTDPVSRRFLTGPGESVDIRRAMDSGRILIVNLDKGRIGEGSASLIGSLLLSHIALAGLTRSSQAERERRDFWVYADEFVARVPADIRFVLARAVFNYDETRTHSAERVFEITGRVA